MKKDIDYKKEFGFLSGILLSETVWTNETIKKYNGIFELLSNNSKCYIQAEKIKEIGEFLSLKEVYKRFVYSYPDDITLNIRIKNTKKNTWEIINIGESVKDKKQFSAFVAFLYCYTKKEPKNMSSRYKENKYDINRIYENSKTVELTKFYNANIDNFIKLFIEAFKNEKQRLNKIEIYISLIDEFSINPNMECYNDLMSKISYLNGVSSINIDSFKELLKGYLEYYNEKNKKSLRYIEENNNPNQLGQLPRNERIRRHNEINQTKKIVFTDDEPKITLNQRLAIIQYVEMIKKEATSVDKLSHLLELLPYNHFEDEDVMLKEVIKLLKNMNTTHEINELLIRINNILRTSHDKKVARKIKKNLRKGK